MELGFSSFMVDHEDHENSPQNSRDSSDTKSPSTSSPKRSRRGTQKRVVSVPIKEVESLRLKGEANAPPPDSWAWRKYGQKPIKGSPYPRGYYRCSSSKGCPARKQVERSRTDPTMVVVTYSCDHNHPWPASRNHHHTAATSPSAATEPETPTVDDQTEDPPRSEPEPDEKFTSLEVGPTDQFGWFSDLESTSEMLECPLMAGDIVGDADMAMIFSIREEDESLFADLGELPECTTVFQRKEVKREGEHHHRRPCNLAPWCGTTG